MVAGGYDVLDAAGKNNVARVAMSPNGVRSLCVKEIETMPLQPDTGVFQTAAFFGKARGGILFKRRPVKRAVLQYSSHDGS